MHRHRQANDEQAELQAVTRLYLFIATARRSPEDAEDVTVLTSSALGRLTEFMLRSRITLHALRPAMLGVRLDSETLRALTELSVLATVTKSDLLIIAIENGQSRAGQASFFQQIIEMLPAREADGNGGNTGKTFRLPQSAIDKVTSTAEQLGIRRSAFVRAAILLLRRQVFDTSSF